jgi:hypothetical protein
MGRGLVACDTSCMRYVFHGHESRLDLQDVVAFEPELCARAARRQGEHDVEDAVAFIIDLYGARYVSEQQEKLDIVMRRWAYLVPFARSLADRERLRAVPDRLAWRFDAVWPEGRAALHLMLRAVALRTGCDIKDAPLHVDHRDVHDLFDALVDGLRAGFARAVDAAFAIDLLERAVGAVAVGGPAAPLPEGDVDWAAQVSTQVQSALRSAA